MPVGAPIAAHEHPRRPKFLTGPDRHPVAAGGAAGLSCRAGEGGK
jgi:hypothetical protein